MREPESLGVYHCRVGKRLNGGGGRNLCEKYRRKGGPRWEAKMENHAKPEAKMGTKPPEWKPAETLWGGNPLGYQRVRGGGRK